MMHVYAYSQSQDTAGVLLQVNAVPDETATLSGQDILVPSEIPNLLLVAAMGVTISRAQIQSPSLRAFVNLEIAPVRIGALDVGNPPVYRDAMFDPIPLKANEGLRAMVAETAAGAERETIVCILGDKAPTVLNAGIFTVRVTATQTLVANAWTNGAIVFDQTLPAGRYALVGARFESAGGIAFRMFTRQSFFRPGGLMRLSLGLLDVPGQRFGGWGEWLQFEHTTPPTVDFLSGSADTTETGFLDLLKIG